MKDITYFYEKWSNNENFNSQSAIENEKWEEFKKKVTEITGEPVFNDMYEILITYLCEVQFTGFNYGFNYGIRFMNEHCREEGGVEYENKGCIYGKRAE